MPWESPSLAGKSAKADRVLEGPGVCLRGGYGCGLASNQGRERLALMATMSAHLPAQNACLLVHAVVLKLRLQSTDAGRRLSSAVQRQPEGPRVWSRPPVLPHAGWCKSTTEALLSVHARWDLGLP